MPFAFNAVELCVLINNEKSLVCASEVCRALKYGMTTKVGDIVKNI